MNKREEERLRKKEEKHRKELERLEVMSAYEKEYAQYTHICGIDEVGTRTACGSGSSVCSCVAKRRYDIISQ